MVKLFEVQHEVRDHALLYLYDHSSSPHPHSQVILDSHSQLHLESEIPPIRKLKGFELLPFSSQFSLVAQVS